MAYRVAIVDDHVLVAKALAGIVERFGNFQVLYEVENGKKLMDRFADPANIPDVVLLDVKMPEMNGFATAAWLKEHHPAVNILALSVQEDEESLIQMMRSGAQGYLLKNVNPQELKIALETVIEKGYYYPDWVAHAMVQRATGRSPQPTVPQLNAREQEFMQYIATDLTYKEIADKMCVAPRTAEGYRDSIFEKFEVKSRVALVVYALKHQLIEL